MDATQAKTIAVKYPAYHQERWGEARLSRHSCRVMVLLVDEREVGAWLAEEATSREEPGGKVVATLGDTSQPEFARYVCGAYDIHCHPSRDPGEVAFRRANDGLTLAEGPLEAEARIAQLKADR